MEQMTPVPTVMTTTFTLCDLVSLEWHVYSLAVQADATSRKKKVTKKAAKVGVIQIEDTALTVFFQRLQQRDAVCVLVETSQMDTTPFPMSSSNAGELWAFIVNEMQSGVLVEPPTGILRTQTGSWMRAVKPLDTVIQKHFVAALGSVFRRKLLAQEEFVLTDEGFYEPNDDSFIFRCPSLTKLNHVEVYLKEEFPQSAFQMHFRLFEPSSCLTVTVDVVTREDSMASHGAVGVELGNTRCSWERLVGLPTQKNHSMVDVWHIKDGLVPRMIAETKFADVVPLFRTISKRAHKRRMDDDEGSENDEEVKKDENEEDADEDEDDNNPEVDVETDELLRRPISGGSAKAKRNRDSADSTENDESFAPISPEMHVNTPDTAGPIIHLTLPHDDDIHVRVDPDVKHFKRRRRGDKVKGANNLGFSLTFGPAKRNGTGSNAITDPVALANSGVKGTALNPTQLFCMAKASFSKSGPASTRPKDDVKPLSVAVSLVESLSHNEQQEALEVRPVRTHPLLQALQDYVDDEAKVNVDARLTSLVSTKVSLLPNADAFIPPSRRSTVGRLSLHRATADQLRLWLCSDRFKCWRSDYTTVQYSKDDRQQKKEHQRQILLAFDEVAFEKRAQEEAVKSWSSVDQFKVRDDEIALGIRMAASDAMVTWRQEPDGIREWSARSNLQVTTASASDKCEIMNRVQPYLQSLLLLLKREDKEVEIGVRKTKCGRRWMSFEEYTQVLAKSRDTKRIKCVCVEEVPKLCVSTLESSYHVECTILSEYLLRDLHPVAAPKPVDYVVICPQSPAQWLASLALSYLTSFCSMYTQCHLGDLAPTDLSQVQGNHYVSIDASNGLLLVDCAERMLDPFANFRAAGKLLSPVLLSGAIRKTQAFSRSAVGNVVFLIVPIRRSNVKHKMWSLGAFSSGLFGTESTADLSGCKDSVTIEMVYLDDLYEGEVNPSPFMLMPNSFGLYDRVCENINLKPVDGVSSCAGQSRLLCERLYHLADWRAGTLAKSKQGQVEPPYIYGGYVLSEDRKWIACSCTDAVGSVLETHMIPVETTDSGLENALLKMMLKMLHFFAYFGEKSVFVITRLANVSGASCLDTEEQAAWESLRSNRFEELIPMAFTPLLSCVLLLQLQSASNEEVQLREDLSSATLYVLDNLGFAVMPFQERTAARTRSRAVLFTGSDAWKSTCLLDDQHALTQKRETRILKVTLVLALLPKSIDCRNGQVTALAPASMMNVILRDFHAQSYLTMHPITMERQSPLPYHLAAISKLNRELQVLKIQLTTDPLQTR